MAIHVALNHKTEYRFDRPVTLAPHLVRLRPAPHCRTPILSYSLRVTPEKHFINWQQDPQGNYLARLVFPDKATSLTVEVDLVAEMAVYNPFDFFLESYADKFPFKYEPWFLKELAPFLETPAPGPLLAEYLKSIDRKETPTLDFLVALNQQLSQAIQYIIRLEPGIQTAEETLKRGQGSCRDTGWLLVQILRNLGLAARFTSGYLVQLVADVKALDGPSGATSDFTDLHAWAEVYLPGAGWIGFDPTSGLLAGEGHIPLACTPEAASAAPVTGAVDKCETEFSFAMTVKRIHESPRVTKPYTEGQWQRIEALGHRIDEELAAGDVRLTMGGEPTFVSIDDMDGAEWNTAALGPKKRELAAELVLRLKEKFAVGGLLHFGQGKWYPGESLPRWAFGMYWRKDGVPIWENPALIADEKTDYGYTDGDAQRFITALAGRLGVNAEHALPGYEDVWYYLWKERRLPINVDPFKSKLKNAEDRARLAKIWEQGLAKVVGYALPLRRETNWVSGAWTFRPERMYLIPGDSPMGYRLPLESLAWEAKVESKPERDLIQDLPPLSQRHRVVRAADTTTGVSEQSLVRTALCVEARAGKLHIFMPPAALIEDYLDLVQAIEETAGELQMPVLLEGYTPPHDYRIEHIKITPDPGVIEVNLQPAKTWSELVTNTTTLYDEARQTRLGTEKFMLDGRHTGTGGGNHIVIGGTRPTDSPLLRRPDLLRSLVSYWHNHPSLSYLFSGMFIGPTSQHPRVDEARNDQVHELEIACQQLPEKPLPWLVDRVFRNLLVDVTGNTHRAEFCIDKLFPPEGGRLGLLELRAFEMPPHARMSLTQQLLLRALIAKFWKEPYHQKLVRWGTELHDRFLLPHFVSEDFADAIADLPLEFEWFAPHFEFRFPFYGEIAPRGVRVELRQALEPWHVLGEEPGAGGTVRYVDSSVERAQVKVRGLTDSRHVVAVNGRRVPLHPTGNVGEFVAGVRYRAWQPAACLHPTIPSHAPLVFDVLDTWNGRSVGGCTYHVAHPGGRNYVTFPVNAYEAESRRLARFFKLGHTPGPMTAPPEQPNPDFPFTLDLRRV